MVGKLMVALVATLLSLAANAGSAVLFGAADFVAAKDEAKSLRATEAHAVAQRRASKLYRNVRLIRIYPASVRSGVFSVHLPGAKAPIELRRLHDDMWAASALPDDAVPLETTRLSVSESNYVQGWIRGAGKVWQVTSLPGDSRFATLAEVADRPEPRDRIASEPRK